MDRKTQILELATDLMAAGKSFSSLSYQDLATPLGVSKPSIHHHFATKEELGLALVAFFRANGDRLFARLLELVDGSAECLEGYLVLAEPVLLDGLGRVCPFGVFEADTALLGARHAAALRELLEHHLDEFATVVEAAREAGTVTFEGPARDVALGIHCALHGARAVAPILGRETFARTTARIRRGLGLTDDPPAALVRRLHDAVVRGTG